MILHDPAGYPGKNPEHNPLIGENGRYRIIYIVDTANENEPDREMKKAVSHTILPRGNVIHILRNCNPCNGTVFTIRHFDGFMADP
jgi:hypothetical protein